MHLIPSYYTLIHANCSDLINKNSSTDIHIIIPTWKNDFK